MKICNLNSMSNMKNNYNISHNFGMTLTINPNSTLDRKFLKFNLIRQKIKNKKNYILKKIFTHSSFKIFINTILIAFQFLLSIKGNEILYNKIIVADSKHFWQLQFDALNLMDISFLIWIIQTSFIVLLSYSNHQKVSNLDKIFLFLLTILLIFQFSQGIVFIILLTLISIITLVLLIILHKPKAINKPTKKH